MESAPEINGSATASAQSIDPALEKHGSRDRFTHYPTWVRR
jgi:hypothetical protein